MSYGWNPKYNARGEIVGSGNQGSGTENQVWIYDPHGVNGHKVAGPGWGGDWWSLNEILYNNGHTTALLNVRTLAPAVPISDQPYNDASVAPGVAVAAFVSSGAFRTDIFTGNPPQLAQTRYGDGPTRLSPDGRTLAYATPYHAEIRQLYINGVTNPAHNGRITHIAVCNRAIAWQAATGTYTRNIFGFRDNGPVEQLNLTTQESVELVDDPDGTVWMHQFVWSTNRVVIRRWGATEGWVLPPGEYYNASARVADGRFWYVFSSSAGVLGELSIPLTQPMVPLTEGGSIPIPPVPSLEGEMQVAAIPRKVWIAPFFSHSEQYGMTPLSEHAGNAIWVGGKAGDPGSLARNLDLVRPLGRPMIVATDQPIAEANYNTTVAYWVSGSTADELGATVARASALPEKAIVAYLDGDGWPTYRPSWVTDRVWPSVQAYRFAGETLNGFDTRVTAVLRRVAGYGVYLGLTPRFDDFNGSQTVANIVECMPLYSRWLREFLTCVFMPFSDRRGNGMAAVPILREWAQAFLLANIAQPNRYDYWFSPTNSVDTVLHNKLGQTVEMVVLTPAEKTYLLEAMEGTPNPGPGPIEPPLPPSGYEPIASQIAVVQSVWDRCTEEQRKTPVFVSEQTAFELRSRGIIAHEVGGATSDWCVNQKRGVQGDSEDAISVAHPHGAGGFAIIDVLAGFHAHVTGGAPAWTDQTQVTIDNGTIGGCRLPRNLLGS